MAGQNIVMPSTLKQEIKEFRKLQAAKLSTTIAEVLVTFFFNFAFISLECLILRVQVVPQIVLSDHEMYLNSKIVFQCSLNKLSPSRLIYLCTSNKRLGLIFIAFFFSLILRVSPWEPFLRFGKFLILSFLRCLFNNKFDNQGENKLPFVKKK